MYINFDLLEKEGFEWKNNELLVIFCIRQKEYERLDNCSESLNKLFQRKLVTKTSSLPKNKPAYLGARLTMKAKSFLKELQIAKVTEEAKELTKNLIDLYESRGLLIGNKKEIVELVAWFLAETQEEGAAVYDAVENYVMSTEKTYISKLNNLIWKGKNVFATNWDLADSKLYELLKK